VIAHRIYADEVGDGQVGLVAAHTVRNAAGTKFILRKGDVVRPEHLAPLQALGHRHLHLVEIGEDDVHEAEAGRRLAQAVAGPGVDSRGPTESQFTLVARHRGLLRVDADALYAVNDLEGISVLTRFDYQPVDAGAELAGAKVTPLVLPRRVVERVEAVCAERRPLRVLPFRPQRVGAIVLERIDARARDRFQAALEHKLDWFGSELMVIREASRADPEAYADAMRDVLRDEPDLIMAAGASSLDPLEPLFGALDRLDARIVKHGVPVHPGSLFWMACVGRAPLFGLSSCEMFSHKTVLDLVLPRLLAGEAVGREDLVRLGLGGMLGREMAYRFPPYDADGAS
jgi:hypothetical protein